MMLQNMIISYYHNVCETKVNYDSLEIGLQMPSISIDFLFIAL